MSPTRAVARWGASPDADRQDAAVVLDLLGRLGLALTAVPAGSGRDITAAPAQVKAGPESRAGAWPVLQDRVAPAACSIVEECPVAEVRRVARQAVPLDSLAHLPDAVQSALRESVLDLWAAMVRASVELVRPERPFRWASLGRAPQHASVPERAAAVEVLVMAVQPAALENRGGCALQYWPGAPLPVVEVVADRSGAALEGTGPFWAVAVVRASRE